MVLRMLRWTANTAVMSAIAAMRAAVAALPTHDPVATPMAIMVLNLALLEAKLRMKVVFVLLLVTRPLAAVASAWQSTPAGATVVPPAAGTAYSEFCMSVDTHFMDSLK
jgi:hypothetical protein